MHSHLSRRVLNLVVFPWMVQARVASSSSAAACVAEEAWAGSSTVTRGRVGFGMAVHGPRRYKGKEKENGEVPRHASELPREKEASRSIPRPGSRSSPALPFGLSYKPALPNPTTSTPQSRRAAPSSKPPPPIRKPPKPTSLLPTTLHSLLSDRLYRLAYFHLVDILETDTERFRRWLSRGVIQRVIATFEKQNATRLAAILRWKILSKLGQDAERHIEPATPLYPVNTELSTYIATPAPLSAVPSKTAANNPLKEKADSIRSFKHFKPPPSQSQHQVRRLLSHINDFKATRGFQPDFITANLVLKVWLRGIVEPASSATPAISSDKIRMVFRAWSKKTGAPQKRAEYEKIHRPLGKMFVKALKTRGDRQGVEDVVDWLREVRAAVT